MLGTQQVTQARPVLEEQKGNLEWKEIQSLVPLAKMEPKDLLVGHLLVPDI